MSWFSHLFSRKRRYDDISVSIQEHLDERIDELMEEGIPPSRSAAAAGHLMENSSSFWPGGLSETIFPEARSTLLMSGADFFAGSPKSRFN